MSHFPMFLAQTTSVRFSKGCFNDRIGRVAVLWFWQEGVMQKRKECLITRVKETRLPKAGQQRLFIDLMKSKITFQYGERATEQTPPFKRMLEIEIPVGVGTDSTRVASYNHWVSLYWLVTGRTVGRMQLYPEANRLDRLEALRLYTVGSSWFSGEEGKKGMITGGASCRPGGTLRRLLHRSGRGDQENRISSHPRRREGGLCCGGIRGTCASPSAGVSPDWSPVGRYGGYHRSSATPAAIHKGCACHGQRPVWLAKESRLWGLGCDCFAF
jgi:hypothetical protein